MKHTMSSKAGEVIVEPTLHDGKSFAKTYKQSLRLSCLVFGKVRAPSASGGAPASLSLGHVMNGQYGAFGAVTLDYRKLNMMLADPSFLYRLLLEQATTIGCSVCLEFQNRKDRVKREWDLVLVHMLTVAACDAIVVWLLATCRSYGNILQFDLQNTLQKLPNNIFERSYPLREFDLQKRIHSFFYKAAELCMAGLTAGAVQGSLSNYLASKEDGRYEANENTVSFVKLNSYLCQYQVQALMHLVMVAFLGLYANMRYQLLCGYDRAMFNHFDVITVVLFFSVALRIFSMKHLLAAYICYICETFKLVSHIFDPNVGEWSYWRFCLVCPRKTCFIFWMHDFSLNIFQRVQPIVVDPATYLSRRSQIFHATEKRKTADAFKVFTGTCACVFEFGSCYEGAFAAVMLDKGKLDMSQKQFKSSPEIILLVNIATFYFFFFSSISDLSHVFSSIRRDLNFIDHTSDLGWKE
ncbi:hypothetical protein FEM48_Zijuj10G0128800 [Ziziphus jujuba var. spinosa]|uniref:Uncharacterized protein n=1 Tax=Ziziphus jujuba var. spinosa TaxID=714518 RepID=A0A978UNH6_ZIZJJ|nr:hypothetical protein FEM48_Zijuj10G0128800 [Ziziphus jujuba var. spinosa]